MKLSLMTNLVSSLFLLMMSISTISQGFGCRKLNVVHMLGKVLTVVILHVLIVAVLDSSCGLREYILAVLLYGYVKC